MRGSGRATDGAQAEVAHAGVDHLGPPSGRSVAPTVVVRAQERAPLDHACAGSRNWGWFGVEAGVDGRGRVGSTERSRVCRRPRDVGRRRTSPWSIPTRCRPCRRGRTRWGGTRRPAPYRRDPSSPRVLPRELALPEVGEVPATGDLPRRPTPRTPGKGVAVERHPALRTPTRLRWAARPPTHVGECLGVLVGDVHDRMVLAVLDGADPGPSGWHHDATGCPGPPLADVAEIHRSGRHREDERPWYEVLRVALPGNPPGRADVRRRSHGPWRRRTRRTRALVTVVGLMVKASTCTRCTGASSG
jgi:hypothetical protein